MKNLGRLYNSFPKKYKILILAAVSHEGGINFFRNNNFILNQDRLSYAKQLAKDDVFLPFDERQSVMEGKEKKKKTKYEKEKNVFSFLENFSEKSSIYLPKKSL
jgi:hypothetical protein